MALHRILVALGCVGIALVSMQSAGARGGRPAAQSSAAQPVIAPLVESRANILDRAARAAYGQTYGGLVVNSPDESSITIYLTALSTSAEGALSALTPARLTFAKTNTSIADLEALQFDLESKWSDLQASGVPIVGFWSNVPDGLEHIQIDGLSPQNSGQYQATIAGAVGATSFTLVDAGPATTTGRLSDATPYTSGDAVYETNVTGCSSGFGYSKDSTSYFLTAAHCFAKGDTIRNGLCKPLCNVADVEGSHEIMGTVAYRNTVQHTAGDPANQAMDIELVQSDAGSTVWRGAPGSSYVDYVNGISVPAVGDTVCNSGAYSGGVCGTVGRINQCRTESDGDTQRNVCHLVYATSDNNGVLNESGDSGGPVFRVPNGQVLATGIVSASDTSTTCTYNTFEACYSDLYFTGIAAINDYYLGGVLSS